jgi:putative transposase
MDTQKVTAEYRLLHWMKVIQEQQNSGQSIKEFCESTGISRNAFFYWQRKLRKAACAELAKLEKPVNYIPEGWIQLGQDQKVNPRWILK